MSICVHTHTHYIPWKFLEMFFYRHNCNIIYTHIIIITRTIITDAYTNYLVFQQCKDIRTGKIMLR